MLNHTMGKDRHEPMQLLLTCLLTPNCVDNISIFPTAWVLWSKAGTDQLSAAAYCSKTAERGCENKAMNSIRESTQRTYVAKHRHLLRWRVEPTSVPDPDSWQDDKTNDKTETEGARRTACVWVPVCVDCVCVIEHPQGSDVINRRHLDGFLHPSTFIVVKRINLVWLQTALRSVSRST